MRRTCQVFVGTKRCGKPAVDAVDIYGIDISSDGDSTELLSTRVPMCAYHWDEYQYNNRNQNDKP